MPKNDTKQIIKDGFLWNSINRIGTLGIQFVAIFILSRLLSKEDFALMGIVAFFNAISNVLVDSGMGGSLVWAKNVGKKDYSTLFVYNLVIGCVLCLLLVAFSKMIADFYNEESLIPILCVIGASIIISSLGKVQNVILIREFKFKVLGQISLIASIISLAFAIVLGFMGYGIWALVIQNVTYNLFTVILQFSHNRFVPQLLFSKESFKEQWAFGGHLFFSQALQTIYNNIFSAIFPKISSLSFAGLYSQASKLQQLPVGVFITVLDGATFPVLCKIEDQKLFKETNRNIISKFYLSTFALFLLAALTSKPLIVIALGEKWMEASTLLSILSIVGVCYMIMGASRNTLKSLGKTRVISHLEIYKIVIAIIVLFISISYGNYAIIVGILVSAIISSVITVFVLAKQTTYKLKEQLIDIGSPILVLLPSYIFSHIIMQYINMSYLVSLFAYILIYIIFIIMIGHIGRNAIIIEYSSLLSSKIKSFF